MPPQHSLNEDEPTKIVFYSPVEGGAYYGVHSLSINWGFSNLNAADCPFSVMFTMGGRQQQVATVNTPDDASKLPWGIGINNLKDATYVVSMQLVAPVFPGSASTFVLDSTPEIQFRVGRPLDIPDAVSMPTPKNPGAAACAVLERAGRAGNWASDVAVGVLTGLAPDSPALTAIHSTWAARACAPVYYGDRAGYDGTSGVHMLGRTDLTADSALLEYLLAPNPAPLSAAFKFLLAIQDLHTRHPDAAWYVLVDDSTYLSLPNLMLLLADFQDPESQRHFIGGDGCPSQDYVCTESGLVFSRGATASIVAQVEAFVRMTAEDPFRARRVTDSGVVAELITRAVGMEEHRSRSLHVHFQGGGRAIVGGSGPGSNARPPVTYGSLTPEQMQSLHEVFQTHHAAVRAVCAGA